MSIMNHMQEKNYKKSHLFLVQGFIYMYIDHHYALHNQIYLFIWLVLWYSPEQFTYTYMTMVSMMVEQYWGEPWRSHGHNSLL